MIAAVPLSHLFPHALPLAPIPVLVVVMRWFEGGRYR